MNSITPYLFFNGNCRQAMTFYKECFGGELFLLPYGDAPASEQENAHNKGAKKDEIMHSTLSKNNFTLMASDWPNHGSNQGNNIHLNINCETMAEIEKLFKTLSADGKIELALSDTFWGARFGMLIDKYGIHWMLNCPLKK